MHPVLWFLIGMVTGVAGTFIYALCVVAARADHHPSTYIERYFDATDQVWRSRIRRRGE